MYAYQPNDRPRASFLLGIIALASTALAGCASTAEAKQSQRYQDIRTCEDFGLRYGTPAFGDCMLAQQARRDNKQRDSIEKSQMLSQIAKDGQLMAERARKQRCERNPDRRECKKAN